MITRFDPGPRAGIPLIRGPDDIAFGSGASSKPKAFRNPPIKVERDILGDAFPDVLDNDAEDCGTLLIRMGVNNNVGLARSTIDDVVDECRCYGY